MARWGARLAAVVMLIIFALVMSHLYRQLRMLEASRTPATSTAPSR